jgi:hypothetical protein
MAPGAPYYNWARVQYSSLYILIASAETRYCYYSTVLQLAAAAAAAESVPCLAARASSFLPAWLFG